MKRNAMYKYLMVLTAASAVGLQGWRTLFNNFAVEVVGVNGWQVGVVQSLREVPGFLAFAVIFLLYLIKEYHLSAISILLMGTGIALTGLMPSYAGLIFTTILMSVGFHYYETTNTSLTLQYFDEHEAPMVMGKQRSLSALCNIIVGLVIFLSSKYLSYKFQYLFMGTILVLASLWALSRKNLKEHSVKQHKKLIFKKKYILYYILNLMAGARRQVFIVFSVFLMVKVFAFSIREITVLFVLNNLINYFLCPLIAKAVVKYGEKKVLSLEYVSLFFIFIAYAFAPNKIFVGVLYVLDHIFFNFSMGIKSYFQKVADPQDIAPSAAVSFTINHISAVLLPLLGGALWAVNHKIPFFLGACFSLISLYAVSRIDLKN